VAASKGERTMGLADRDYARPSLSGRGYGVGRGVPFNTWLIIINVAVFILGHIVLANVWIPISAGTGYYQETLNPQGQWVPVTSEMIDRAVVDRSVQRRDPDQPALFLYHPIIDPSLARRNAAGELLFDLRTGRFSGEIGRSRIMHRPIIDAVGHFSTGKAFSDLQLWRFLTFQFLHANFTHLLFNMLGLWFFGGMVEARLGPRRYAAFYLLCGAAGAALYLILNLLGYGLGLRLPGVLFSDPYTPLVGASAGVFGVLLAAAALYPREIVYVMFAIPMRLRTTVYIFTAVAAYNLLTQSSNAGGEAAHLGGAAAGALLIRRTHFLDEVVDFFSFSRRSPTRRTARRPAGAPRGWYRDEAEAERDAVDRILAKVHARGIDSLTPEERETLRRATRRSGS